MPDWIDIGPLDDLPEGRPVLRKGPGGERFACVREGERVHVIDDRCPHQGYPLSSGTCKDGVLTCEWHNWKFELQSGACTFGGEPVRRYDSRCQGGRVLVDPTVDRARERERAGASLRDALRKGDVSWALRDALRLGGPLAGGFELIARDSAERAEYGFDHSLALLADLVAWSERRWVDDADAFVSAAVAVGEFSLHLAPRERPAEGAAAPGDPSADLAAERRAEAEAGTRALVRARGGDAAVAALLPFVSTRLLDYGHGLIYLAKARELAARFPGAAEDIFAALAVQLAWATNETALPPWRATRDALAASFPLRAPGDAPLQGATRAAYEERVLAGERDAVDATIAMIDAGHAPAELVRASAHAAAVRLARFDRGWEDKLDAEVGVLDVSHVVTYAEAALALAAVSSSQQAARLALLAAAFVGKVRHADGPAAAAPAPARGSLVDAARARDVTAALAIAQGLDGDERRDAYPRLAPFCAFEAAVRPIFYAHTVKTSEALRRLDAADPAADGAYLVAALSFVVPRRRERYPARIATVAREFLRTGRPPETLY